MALRMPLKLGHKIFLLVLIPFGFVVVAGAFLSLAQRTTSDAAAWMQHSALVLDETRDLQRAAAGADADERGYLITGDASYVRRFAEEDAQTRFYSRDLERLVADNPSQEAAARTLVALGNGRSADMRAAMASFGRSRESSSAAVRMAMLSQTRSADQFRRHMDAFATTETQLQSQRAAALRSSIGRLDRLLLVTGIVALVLTLVLLHVFGQDTVRRMSELGEKADRLARGLPLGPRPPSFAGDEVGRADKAFHDMADSLEQRQAITAKFRLLAENTRDIILFLRRSDARITEVNDAAVDAYGYTREELLSMTAADLRTPEAKAHLMEDLAASDRGPVFYESQHRRKDGSTFPIEVTGAGATINGERVLMSIVRDISERKRAERGRDRFFEASLDMMCVADFAGYFVQLNRAWETTLGYTRAELCAVPFVELIHPDDRDATAVAMRALVSGDTVVNFENRYRRKDGTYLWFAWSAIPAPEDGLVYAVARDVTERKRKDEELARSRDRATEASRVKSEFLANMSHEIRTPMNGIIGTTALLQAMSMSADQREYVDIIRESGEALLTIINQILDLSKLEAGKVTLEVMDFSPLSVVESVTMLFAPAARQRGLSIQSFVAADVPPSVRGDAGQLRQVLINLAGNAVKFTQEGSVVVRVALESMDATDVVLRFSVVDTGIGLPADAVGQLFEPFTQGDASTTRRYGGTGLGLSISRQIVALMGGEIGVEPNEDRGTTFWFTARFHASAAPIAKRTGLFNGVRVLIADPDPVSRDVLHQYLHNWGMRNGLIASTAAEAVAALRRAADDGDPYDLAFIDSSIDQRDGSFERAVAADPGLATTRLILMKALAAENGPAPAGFAYFLSKPIRQSYLFDCVTAALSRAPAQEAAPAVAAEPAAPQPSGTPAASVLVAEDNEINRRLAAAQFKVLGVDVDFVTNGKEAVDAVAGGRYDLVFMDCQMPVMDGFEATRAIRKREIETGAHVPIIAVTANAMEGDRETCVARGMDDYLSKPVDVDGLRRALDQWLPPPIDMQRVRALFGDDDESTAGLLRASAEESRAVFARLRSAIAARDADAAAVAAHELKGFTSNVGARRMATLAADLERDAKSREWDRAATHLGALGAAVDRFADHAGRIIALLAQKRSLA